MTILERLRAATGPDRSLDVAIWFDLVEPRYLWTQDREQYWHVNRAGTAMTPVWQDDTPLRHAPEYTSSIDAALALVERMLQGCSKEISFEDDEWYFRFLSAKGGIPIPVVGHVFPHKTAPLAILTALFAAIEAKERT